MAMVRLQLHGQRWGSTGPSKAAIDSWRQRELYLMAAACEASLAVPDRCQHALTRPFRAVAMVRTVLQGHDAAAAAWAAMQKHRIIYSSA